MSRSSAHPGRPRADTAVFPFGLSRATAVGFGTAMCSVSAVPDEEMHFFACGACGQMLDARDLGAVIYHEAPDHKPIATN